MEFYLQSAFALAPAFDKRRAIDAKVRCEEGRVFDPWSVDDRGRCDEKSASLSHHSGMHNLFLPSPNSVLCKTPSVMVAIAGPVKSLDLKLGAKADFYLF